MGPKRGKNRSHRHPIFRIDHASAGRVRNGGLAPMQHFLAVDVYFLRPYYAPFPLAGPPVPGLAGRSLDDAKPFDRFDKSPAAPVNQAIAPSCPAQSPPAPVAIR